MGFRKIFFGHKNNKIQYYSVNYLRQLIPSKFFQNRRKIKLKILESLPKVDVEKILHRVNYYNQLENSVPLSSNAEKLSKVKLNKASKVYFFDLYEYARFFNQQLKGHFLFGDITYVPNQPSLVKSRPVSSKNNNSVVLKWDKVRHFMFIKNDKKQFLQKKDKLVFRGKVFPNQIHRVAFLETYSDHPMCDIGMTNENKLNPLWRVKRMTIDDHLDYKFILSLEGNDVATNLKWVMSSNSIAIMPKPKFESWFMEGLLIPDYHYILIKDDYSDLFEKLEFYIKNPDKAVKIVENSKHYITQFQNKNHEDIISLLVLEKYFKKTQQLLH